MEKGSWWTAPTATEPANFLSGLTRISIEALFPGKFTRKTTTMRRTIRLQIRLVRALSGRFLRAMIVEWLFPMHFVKALPRLQRMPS